VAEHKHKEDEKRRIT